MPLPKSKQTYFKGNSNGKKSFPGEFKGPKQKKQMKKGKIKQKRQMAVKTPTQVKTQPSFTPPRKRQQYLVPTPRQPRPMMGWDDKSFMRRLRRATS